MRELTKSISVIYDKELKNRPVFSILDGERYMNKTFIYSKLWQCNITEKTILNDINKIPITKIDFSKRATVIFRHNPKNTIIKRYILEWIISQLAARLITTSEILWGVEESDSLTNRQLEISINIPIKYN